MIEDALVQAALAAFRARGIEPVIWPCRVGGLVELEQSFADLVLTYAATG
jgi:hypothetical protein